MCETRHHLRVRLGGLLGATLLTIACNGLLDNRPRELEASAGSGGDATSGAAGQAAESVSTTRGASGGAHGGSMGGGTGGVGGSITGNATSAGTMGAGGSGATGTQTSAGSTGTGNPECPDVQPECSPGDSEPTYRQCACGGTQQRTKTCNDDCTWTLGPWGPCEGIECEPGAQSAPVVCDCDDTRTTVRTCTESCTWGPPSSCEAGCGSAPTSLPGTTTDINIWTTAIGRSGTSACCPKTGESRTGSNPQYVWCRRWGGVVSDDKGNFNHWWLWTEFDDPEGTYGWISAYYIDGQGNDQAEGIPDCP